MADELTFIGTATAVLRLGGFTLLTDPNFLHKGQRAYLGYGLWARRRTEPAWQVDHGGTGCARPGSGGPVDAAGDGHGAGAPQRHGLHHR